MKRKIFLPLLLSLVLLSGFQATAQPEKPVVAVRFANPTFDCDKHIYCLDVEFMANIEGQQLFGMNVRFFYDDNVLEFLSMGDFQEGYNSPAPPQIETYPDPQSIAFFGLGGPVEWINGDVLKTGPSSIYLSTNDSTWTKLFNICFHVDDPNAIGISSFCPSIIWDLQENFLGDTGGGYNWGDDGVVMSVVDLSGLYESVATTENVVQFNWVYAATANSVGHPVSSICKSTICGIVIPLANWSLFLAIGLMLVVSVFIYRRRISG